MVYLSAIASGLAFAVAAVLQHREARAQPPDLSLSIRLLHQLLRRPLWWLGGVADATGLLFQAIALGSGSIIVVEALRTTGLLFALGLGAMMGAGLMGARQWGLAGLLVLGITGFLGVGAPVEGQHRARAATWMLVAAFSAAVVAVTVIGSRRSGSALRAMALGVATGAVWALTACLLKRVVVSFHQSGLAAVVTRPALWILLVVSIGGLVLNQSSFQAGELSWSLPAMSVVEPVLGSIYGIVLFHDRLRVDNAAEGVALVAFAVTALTAVAVLARDPAEVAVLEGAAKPSG
ncbi:MAG: hypothetical protein QOJ19_4594 [Acidimicrobiia bacterium]|nr:hypothetical protein [Acidimicrobiia bacterium]